jgi:hypothetical protein
MAAGVEGNIKAAGACAQRIVDIMDTENRTYDVIPRGLLTPPVPSEAREEIANAKYVRRTDRERVTDSLPR